MEVFTKALTEWGRQQYMVGLVLPMFNEWKNVRNAGIHGETLCVQSKAFCLQEPTMQGSKERNHFKVILAHFERCLPG